MKSTQAWGWLAAGVLALGLNGFYQDGGAQWAHQIVDRVASRSGMVLALASGQADRFLSQAGLVEARAESRPCRLATAMASLQSGVERGQASFTQVEAMSSRQEAAFAKLEANRARIEAKLERVRYMPAAMGSINLHVGCPRVRVNVPQVRIPRIEIPEVSIPAMPAIQAGPGSDPI